MSRNQFWTILIGTETTSFRARDRETLVPTLKQLQRRNPDAVIKWFDHDRLFDSPIEAERARMAAEREKRPKDWRPGGEHRDPRARYQLTRDEKRRRFKLRAIKERTGPKADGAASGRPAPRTAGGRAAPSGGGQQTRRGDSRPPSKFRSRAPGQKSAPAARRPRSRAPGKRREE
jgi:hypothetical protein